MSTLLNACGIEPPSRISNPNEPFRTIRRAATNTAHPYRKPPGRNQRAAANGKREPPATAGLHERAQRPAPAGALRVNATAAYCGCLRAGSKMNDRPTLPRIATVAITVASVTGSPSSSAPSATATTGFTYMQLLAMIGLVWRIR